ncbi:MAG: hypothetical protein JXX29_16785 [Deltaproteobacteria bacterium]|nr:hypothetical protein [Deltaproteobacteria bacterium]MBN2673342.1 hypothetical protein [Deltaproteobacteria bacterium]
MSELQIEIRIDRHTEAMYRFSSFPVKIGRDQRNDLSICHSAIARQLCTAWIESNKLIRLEECPDLTNPITEHGKPIIGGLSKQQIHASVGPVELIFSIPHTGKHRNKPTHRRLFIIAAVAFAAAAVMLFAGVFFQNLNPKSSLSSIQFPLEIRFQIDNEAAAAASQIEMLKQHATACYYRLPMNIHNRRNAIEQLLRVRQIEIRSGIFNDNTQKQIQTWRRTFNRAYRAEVAAFITAQKCMDSEQIKESAKNLKAYLARQSPAICRQLTLYEQEGNSP